MDIIQVRTSMLLICNMLTIFDVNISMLTFLCEHFYVNIPMLTFLC